MAARTRFSSPGESLFSPPLCHFDQPWSRESRGKSEALRSRGLCPPPPAFLALGQWHGDESTSTLRASLGSGDSRSPVAQAMLPERSHRLAPISCCWPKAQNARGPGTESPILTRPIPEVPVDPRRTRSTATKRNGVELRSTKSGPAWARTSTSTNAPNPELETESRSGGSVSVICPWSFGFVSDFEFRISLPPMCTKTSRDPCGSAQSRTASLRVAGDRQRSMRAAKSRR
jgi:hypothetical protein